MVSKKTVNMLLASAVALTIAGGAQAAQAAEKEKCYGVVKAGHNDCANAAKTHSCAGHASVDGAGDEWVTVPEGLCAKLVGGSLEPMAATETDAEAEHDHEAGEEH